MFLSHDKEYTVQQSDFSNIPGCPVAYWVNPNLIKDFVEGIPFSEIGFPKVGMQTSNNDKYLRSWMEINYQEFKNAELKKWIKYIKGGTFRRWYGNLEYVVWYNGTPSFILQQKNARVLPESELEVLKCTWTDLGTTKFSCRIAPIDSFHDISGHCFYPSTENYNYLLGLANSSIFQIIVDLLNSSLHYQVGDIARVPVLIDHKNEVDRLVVENTELSKVDWDSFETSWDFNRHPLLTTVSKNHMLSDGISNIDLAECYMCWKNECNEWFNKLKSNEEELNRIFIDIYGLQEELTPEVEDKDVTVRKADLQRDVKSLISYAVGCMFGRYSLSTEGLAYAGGEWDSSKYAGFIPDDDNVIPITDQKYMDDDIVERFCEFLVDVYGEKSLETNLDFIANALGGKGSTSTAIIRNYFLNDFFKDHCKIYQKRPIYWLFDSGKQNGFKALVYMHRWDKNSIGRVLVYLHKIQEKYEIEVRAIDAILEHMTDKRQQAAEEQRRDHLLKQIVEIKEYDERLDHMTNEYIDIDLDDGVKVNYEKVQTDRNGTKFKILAPIK